MAIRHLPEHMIVLQRPKGQAVRIVYNGPGAPVWAAAGTRQKNGQRPIGIAKLDKLNAEVPDRERLSVVRPAPI